MLNDYVKEEGLIVIRSYLESETMSVLTYNNLKSQTKYQALEELLTIEPG